MEKSKWLKDLQTLLQKGEKVYWSVYSEQEERRELFVSTLSQEFPQLHLIAVDVKQYPNFCDFLRAIVLTILEQPELRQAVSSVDEAPPQTQQDVEAMGNTLETILTELNNRKEHKLCLLLRNFAGCKQWDEQDDLAWLRELLDAGGFSCLSCIILDRQAIPDITEKPSDSSPLYNIFKLVEVEE